MAIHQSKQTPTVCYKTVESLSALVKPKIYATKIPDPLVKREDLRMKPKKDAGPDMGSYEAPKVLKELETKGISQAWSNAPIIKFYDSQIKHAKKVPAAGHYKVTSEAINRLSRSPPSIRMRRH